MTALGTTFLLGANEAHSQTQRFRATPLVKLDFAPNADGHGTAGINNKGQVVYGRNIEWPTGVDFRAWVWLPTADYGLAAGVTELNGDNALARDINEAGDIAGQVNEVGLYVGDAAVWQLSTGLTPTTLGNFGGPDPWSSAHAISNHNPPKVVGDSGALRICSCSGSVTSSIARGFLVELGSSLLELSSGSQTVSFARDIVKPFQQSTYQIGGFGMCMYETGNPPTACKTGNTPCDSYTDPKFWNNSLSPIDLAKLSTNDAAAYALNIHGASAGYAYTSGLSCRRHASFWPTSGSSPVDLHENLLDPFNNSSALSMNNLQPPQIVGWDRVIDNFAMLWESDGTNWSALELTSSQAIGQSVNFFTLREAHDINDNGWIICWGTSDFGSGNPLNGVYAILLTPFVPVTADCPADIVVDGQVNVPDLLLVIAKWGLCTVGEFCAADITGDFQVGVADLLAVIINWGPCGQPSDGAPESVEDCHQACASQFGFGTPEYTDCMDKCIRALCETNQLPPEDCPD